MNNDNNNNKNNNKNNNNNINNNYNNNRQVKTWLTKQVESSGETSMPMRAAGRTTKAQISIPRHDTKVNSAFHPFEVDKGVPACWGKWS